MKWEAVEYQARGKDGVRYRIARVLESAAKGWCAWHLPRGAWIGIGFADTREEAARLCDQAEAREDAA